MGDERDRLRALVLGRRRRRVGAASDPRRLARPGVRVPGDDDARAGAPGWYPHFTDYFAFAFATATAFSPTDVAAIKRWAKMLMVLQAVASLVLATLVLAKAINGIGSGPYPHC